MQAHVRSSLQDIPYLQGCDVTGRLPVFSHLSSTALQAENNNDGATLSRWASSSSSRDKQRAGKEAQLGASSAAAPRSTSQHALAASSHSSLTGLHPCAHAAMYNAKLWVGTLPRCLTVPLSLPAPLRLLGELAALHARCTADLGMDV